MKVTILSHSDTIGGASIVTYRLMKALQEQGVDARMIVYTKTITDDNIGLVSKRGRRGFNFLFERMRIAISNGFSHENLFKVSIANIGLPLHKHPWVKDADVIVLGWINQGMLSLKEISKIGKLGKPIVWVMHDMWNMTGICHHAHKCENYKENCGNCFFLGKLSYKHDISRKIFNKKNKLYKTVPITFVAVSNWLAERAKNSNLLKNQEVVVIPNAVPVETFYTQPQNDIRIVDTDKQLILMGAARLDDPIKGLPYMIDALNYLFDNRPDITRRSVAVFFGELRKPELLDKIRFPHVYLNRINDPNMLRDLYAEAKVVVSTSLYETLPGTLIEGQASGCLPVTFDKGGQADIVTHLQNGYIAEYKNPVSVAEGIAWALETPTVSSELHASVKRKFSAENIAKQYIKLFEKILKENNK